MSNMKNVYDIPQDILKEIDFMLGSIEECNSEYMTEILSDHGIYPDGGWIDIDNVSEDVVYDIYERLFKTGIMKPFFTV